MATKSLEIIISGETVKFQTAMKQAEKQTKSLQSELKGINTMLKKDPLNSTLIKQKGQVLGEQLNKTKSYLKDLKSQQDEVTAAFERGDIGEKEYRNFQREIVSSEQKLKALEKQQRIFNASTTSLGMVGRRWQAVGAKIVSAGNKMKAVSAAGAVVAAAIGGLAIKAAQAADDLNTMSKQYGISTKNLQNYKAAAEIVDVSVETLAKTHSKLKKSMLSAKSGTGSAAEAFNQLGIKVTNSNGHLRNGNVVYDEAIKKLGQMKNTTERDALAMAIFGKSAAQLGPLLEDGGKTYKRVNDLMSKNGLNPISQKSLDRANEFQDDIDLIKATFSRASQIIGTKIAGYLVPMMDTVTNKFAAISGKVAGLSGGALAKIGALGAGTAALAPLMIIVGTVIEKTGIVMTKLPLLSGMLSSIWGVLKANPILLVITAIAALIAIFGKLGTSASSVTTFIQNMTTSIVNKISAISASIQAHGAEFISAGIKVVTALIQGIVTALPSLLTAIGGMIVQLAGAIKQNIPQILSSIGAIIQSIGSAIATFAGPLLQAGIQIIIQIVQGIASALPQLAAKLPMIIQTITTGIVTYLPQILQAAVQIIIALAQGLIQALPVLVQNVPAIVRAIATAIISLAGLLLSAGINLMERLGSGIRSGFSSVLLTVSSYARSIPSRIVSAIGSLSSIGRNIIQGLANGIESGFSHVFSLISSLGKKCKNAIKSVFEVHSPSVFTEWVGRMLVKGLPIGVSAEMPTAMRSITKSMNTMKDSLAFSTGISAGLTTGAGTYGAAAAAGNVTNIEQNFTINTPTQSPGDLMRAAKKEAINLGLQAIK
jgi:phage-related protein